MLLYEFVFIGRAAICSGIRQDRYSIRNLDRIYLVLDAFIHRWASVSMI